MAKRVLALVLVLIMCLSFVGCGKNSSEKDSTKDEPVVSETDKKDTDKKDDNDKKPENKESVVTPILYKVTDDDGNVAWLFGSIHIGREDYYPLPDYVMDAYDSSDALAVEFDINAFEKDFQAQTEALQALVYTDGTKIDEHLPKEVYDDAVKIMKEQNLYNIALDYYMPSLWSSFVDNCMLQELGVDLNSGVDKYMLNLAQEDDKEILEVESAQFQYGFMADFSQELQVYLLESSIEEYEDIDDAQEELDEMLDMWASGNEKEFAQMLSEMPEDDMTKEELKLYEEYNDAMIVERNISMTEYVEDVLSSGKEVFVCVGAAHIIGEGAVADRLKDLGYKVERVQ